MRGDEGLPGKQDPMEPWTAGGRIPNEEAGQRHMATGEAGSFVPSCHKLQRSKISLYLGRDQPQGLALEVVRGPNEGESQHTIR